MKELGFQAWYVFATCFIIFVVAVSITTSFGAHYGAKSGYPRMVYSKPIEVPLEIVGMMIYQNIPLGRSSYSSGGQPYGVRLAVMRSFTLGEDEWGDYPPSSIQFILKLGILNTVGVLLVYLFKRQDGVVSAWIRQLGRYRAGWSVWGRALGCASIAVFVSNLVWMLWLKVHWIYRADSDYWQLFNVKGQIRSQMVMQPWTPIAVRTVSQAAVGFGGVLFYFLLVNMLFNRFSLKGANRFGYCAKCGYPCIDEAMLPCPECGLSKAAAVLSRNGRRQWVTISLLAFSIFTLFCAPLWLAWIAPILPDSVLRFIPL